MAEEVPTEVVAEEAADVADGVAVKVADEVPSEVVAEEAAKEADGVAAELVAEEAV